MTDSGGAPFGDGAPTVVAITGASGFLGRHLVGHLLDRPAVRLRLLLRNVAGSPARSERVEVVVGDLRDPDAASALVVAGAIVVNLAYSSEGSPSDNLRMVQSLATACERAGARRLVHCSTAIVAGRARADTVTEATPCRPATRYQRDKLEIEKFLEDRLRGRCALTTVRPTAIIGAGGPNLVSWAARLLRGAPWYNRARAALFANRRTHLVCVENVVASLWFLMSRTGADAEECFIVSDDEEAANNGRDVWRILADEMGLPPIPESDPAPTAPRFDSLLRLTGHPVDEWRRIYSAAKLRGLGFYKPLPLEEGIRRFARAYVASAAGRPVSPDGP